MSWVYAEVVAVSLAAMVSPTTLTFCVLALVLGDRPLRTGLLFYTGALTATLAVGVAAAFVLGDIAASETPSSPKTWVAVVNLAAGGLLLLWVARTARRPYDPTKVAAMVDRMSGVVSSRWLAVLGAGALLANPGLFIPIALKAISETDPTTAGYALQWLLLRAGLAAAAAGGDRDAGGRSGAGDGRAPARARVARTARAAGRSRDRGVARPFPPPRRHRRADRLDGHAHRERSEPGERPEKDERADGDRNSAQAR